MEIKSNMISGIDAFSVSLGDSTINSINDSAESKSLALPSFSLNLKYTFSTQTQVFIGNSLENILQFDTATVAGVKQQFSDKSILEFSFISSPLVTPVQVWADPYVQGVARTETDRTSKGFRLEYAKILGSGFGLKYSNRTTEIDNELSGTVQAGLTTAQAQLLDREGDSKTIAAYYRFKPIRGRHVFELALSQQTDDLDGAAMSGDEQRFSMTYAYIGERFIIASNILVSNMEYDAVHPIYGVTREDDTLGIGLVVFDNKIFGSKNWIGQATAVWYDLDSNIEFYDSFARLFSVGVKYQF